MPCVNFFNIWRHGIQHKRSDGVVVVVVVLSTFSANKPIHWNVNPVHFNGTKRNVCLCEPMHVSHYRHQTEGNATENIGHKIKEAQRHYHAPTSLYGPFINACICI